MPPSPLAVADACVLVPAALGDFLMRSAAADMYQIRWTDDILDEVRRTLVSDLGKSEAQAERRVTAMKRAFPDALVTEHRLLMGDVPNTVDAKDRHVVAAALASGSSIIITSNLRDFPASALAPLGITPHSPDDFLMGLYANDSDAAVTIIMRQAASLRAPPLTPLEVLDAVGLHAPRFATLVRPLLTP